MLIEIISLISITIALALVLSIGRFRLKCLVTLLTTL
jgi:hypothetical protein